MMELPFAVESSPAPVAGTSLEQSDSSLVTASSQGSFGGSSSMAVPLPPNTPQDVVLPGATSNFRLSTPQELQPGHLVTPGFREQQIHDQGYGDGEVIDFTYVNVYETDADEVDILLEGGDMNFSQGNNKRGDILTVLLSGLQQDAKESVINQIETANSMATKALESKKRGELIEALEYHTQAAKQYKDSAMAVREKNDSLAKSMLLLSQTQAKSAIALKGVIRLNPTELTKVLGNADVQAGKPDASTFSHQDRLRAAVRGALGPRHPHEADISDSMFLGRATGGSNPPSSSTAGESSRSSDAGAAVQPAEIVVATSNPVDEMMELERELRDMDMALELGNSVGSLDARMQNRMRNSMSEGSFMVVPPGSNSYMSSSMWGSGQVPNGPRPAPQTGVSGTAGVRARANRVQNMLEASSTPSNRHAIANPTIAQPPTKNSPGLESSWWGNASTASQVLASSVVSTGSRLGTDHGQMGDLQGGQPANTKQLMRLMDSLKTLGDENAALLREVEEAEAARQEAKAAREQMKMFKVEYGKRFSALKAALDKFRQDHPHGKASASNPVNNSDFMKTASATDQLQRQEQLIRKLTTDLKREKEESKKKDAALRKYESFYREVKARSAQKAAQRHMETQQRQHKSRNRPLR